MGVILAKDDKIHDWTTITEIPKHAEPAPIVVDDPHGTISGEKIKVLRALRDDPLADMHNRGQVDDPQFIAGRKWQMYYGWTIIGSVGAIDTTKEKVDGGIGYDGITDDQIRAFKELGDADRELGPDRAFVLRCLLGEGLSATALAKKLGFSSHKRVSSIMETFRDGLGMLVVHWGIGTHKESKRRG